MSAVTQNNYEQLNNSTVQYNFTFPYLKASDIKVSLDAVDTTAFTLANATTIQLNSVPAIGTKIKIFRETGVDNLTATFYAGSAIKSEDLNDNFTQNLYVTQEVNGRYLSTLGGTMTGNFNLGEDADLVFEGATDNANETTITVTDPTADRTITFPDTSGTVVTTGDVQTVTGTMIANGTITSDDIEDGTIVNADINASAAIAGTKVSPDFGSQNISTTGTINNLTTTELAILDDATVTTAELNILDGVTATTAEINLLDGVTATTDEINKLDGVTATTAEINLLDGVTATTTELNLVDGVTATTTEINYIDGVTSGIQGQLDNKQPLDTDLTTLAGMQSGTASKLAGSTTLTADIADLNQIDGMAKETTISDDDTKFPTSGAVVDYVAAQIAPLGGLEVIATDAAFPNTQPSAGVVISISDAGGVVFNGSGSSTTARTVGGSTVTINNAPSSLNSETLVAGVGLMVSSTGSGQIYNYHKILGKEDDIKQLSDDINDFNARYRVGASNPTSALDSGDLFFNTGTGKLLVYNGTNSAWEEAQSIGNFFISTLSPAFDGSTQDFTLANAPTNVQQVLLSINGVVQKPNAGTSTPSEGFALSGSTVKLAAAPASGDTYFAIVMGSTVNIGTPSNNTVTEAILQSNIVSEEKLKVSNDPTNGYFLSAQSGNTGGLTWAQVTTDLVGDTSPQLGGDLQSNGNDIDFADSDKAIFGTGGDLEIYHDGSNSYIEDAGTGALLIKSNTIYLTGTNASNDLASFVEGGAVSLFHNDSKKFETTTTGATVTGELQVTTPFLEMPQTISANKTITNNHNCLTVGPVTINSGITVTVGDGENWVIV